MTGAWVGSLNEGSVVWASAMVRASWQGGAALALAWAASHAWPRMPPAMRCWLWRLAYLKLLVAHLSITPVDLPLLPPAFSAPPAAATAGAPVSAPAAVVSEREAPAARAPASGTAMPSAASGLLLLWLLGVGGSIGRGVWEWREVQRLRRVSEPIQGERVAAACAELCQRLGLHPAPQLLVTPGSGSPLLLGIRRPIIILPASLLTGCSLYQLRLMLAHELAHLRRRDLLWGWLPALAQGLFWFHPLVWLVGREWYLAQELACDEMAVRVSHAPPGDYGEVLLKVAAQYRPRTAGGWAAAGVLESYQTLHRRLIAMKSIGQVSSRRIAWIGGLLAAVGVVILVPWRVTAQTGGNTGGENGGSEQMQAEAQMRLKQLGLALQMYAQDYDEVLPPMKSPAAVKKVLYPYVRKNDAVFLDPRTTEPYQPNASLSGKRIAWVTLSVRRSGHRRPTQIKLPADITRPGEMVAFYELTPAADGTRNVLFVDGHVKRYPEVEWQRLKRSSHIH